MPCCRPARFAKRRDPAVIAKKGIERHHLFPRAYLRDILKVKDTRQINQIANMALVEWNDNIAISDDAPAKYWPEQVAAKAHLDPQRLAQQLELHALPDGWTQLDFSDFLAQRRRLIAAVVRRAFERVSRSDYSAEYPPVSGQAEVGVPIGGGDAQETVSIADLVKAGLLPLGTILTPLTSSIDAVAEIDEQGQILLDDATYATPSGAARAASGASANGWTFWLADTPSGQRRLDSIRDQFRSANVETGFDA